MKPTRLVSLASSLCVLALLAMPALASAATGVNPPLLLRYPSLNETTVAFRYADDIWTVARTGGEAQRLTLHRPRGGRAVLFAGWSGLPE